MLKGRFPEFRAAAVTCAVFSVCCATAQAQQPRQYTVEDYAAAERFMGYNINPLANQGIVKAQWMDDGRFWYRDADASGVTYVLVDPVKGMRTPAFDQAKLAAALKEASGGTFKDDARHLQVSNLALSDGDRVLTLTSSGAAYRCEVGAQPESCKRLFSTSDASHGPDHADKRPPLTLSPNRKLGAFIRDWNLWVRDLSTAAETQLTTDGVKDYGYATDNAGWQHSDRAILLWSPDSTRIATFQQDQRKTGEMYLVPVTNTHPKLQAWRYPLVGDKDVTMIERVVIDVASRKLVRLKMGPDQHRSTICDDVACHGSDWSDVEWSPDDAHLAFVSTSRDHKQEWLRVADTATGEVREVMSETAAKFFESGNGKVNWHSLPASNEILWFSERDDWGNLYLYDLGTGQLKNQITHGPGNVTQVLSVDEKTRTIYFVGVGKEAERDPYFQHFYSVHFDGTGLKLLTPENADHSIKVSPDGRFFVDSYSTPTEPQVTVVRASDGKAVMEVARQDIAKLLAAGWVAPTPIKVRARDGKTDLYGLMFKPSHFDAAKKYPIVNSVYPGPQTGSCGSREFKAAHGDLQALAELGFVVVCIDGMGTPWRSKTFHEAYYGNLGDNTIPDQVSGMKDLAAQYPFIDLDRAGMYGHSGGGNATAAALFHYPDFFKVGIAESGNHDERDYEDDWAEKWAGIEVKNPDGTSNYDSQANQNYAGNLKGHLLLAHGTMDDNVPPSQTLLVVDALIKANKDFDLLLIPGVAHGYGPASQYMTRRRWDYFVRYLAGGVPPAEYAMKPFSQVQAAMHNGPCDPGTVDDEDADGGCEP
ncbi:MAG: DPP IV N-terminal domain-containing protein [Terracidiphilus sp.]|nr:DPP IV N-terminal domain-containing protein [Terracidiphilus sp.]